MIPTVSECKALWDELHVNDKRRVHMEEVAKLAIGIASKCKIKNPGLKIDISLVSAAALLHDADKSVEKLPGETHPDTMVRVLKERGMPEVAEVIRTHSLPAVLGGKSAPKTLEQKLLFLADKMAKYDIIGVNARFALWRSEHILQQDLVLDASYGNVKKLETEIAALVGFDLSDPDTLIDIARNSVI